MTTATAQRKSGRLVIRLTPQDKVLLEQAAASEGCSVGSFIVSHSRAAAERVLREHEAIRLSAEESRRFVQALLALPHAPTRRFKAALALSRRTLSER